MEDIQITSLGVKRSLNKFTEIESIIEYIWNGFDARASQVKLWVNFNALSGIDSIRVEEELQKLIAKEKSKSPVLLTADDIRNYYVQALRLEPKLLINYLIKEIVLFKDKIEIHYNSPVNIGPDENRGFCFATKSINLSLKVPFRKNKIKIGFEIQMFIK